MNIEKMTVNEIKEWLAHADKTCIERLVEDLRADRRKSVQQLGKQCELRLKEERKQIARWEYMNRLEMELHEKGYTYIAGVDEVGRGPLAGPLVVAAVLLPRRFTCLGINDSKALPARKREAFAASIRQQAVDIQTVYVFPEEIDQLNIYQATKKAMAEAVESLQPRAQFALIDHMHLDISTEQRSLVKGDAQSVSIAAASIIAKVSRDAYMVQMAKQYPQYGFEQNKGYGTSQHLEALKRHGVTPLHRQTFLTGLQLSADFNIL